jgi:alpha-L-rhamnosidase
MGATTIWERWDSLLPDGSVNPGEMTSFNHYALGAVADWLHRSVGGLALAAPGYRHLDVRPRPGGGLTHARAQHLTPYGLAECAWKIEAGQIEVVVVVPPNMTATVTLPGNDTKPIEVGSGRHHWSSPYSVERLRHPRSLDSQISEFIDDPEAWTTVLSTMRQHLPGLTGDIDIATFMLHNSTMTLRQVLSLSPHADELRTALEAELAARGC